MTRPDAPDRADGALDQEELWQAGASAGGELPAGDLEEPARARSAGSATTLAQSLTATGRRPGPGGFYQADVPDRIIALIIDIIILSVLGAIVALVLGGLAGGLTSGPGGLDDAGGGLNVAPFLLTAGVAVLLGVAYFAYCWTLVRRTPGMMLLGLEIGDESDAHSIGWDQALRRAAVLGIPATLSGFAAFVPDLVGLLLGIVGVVWLAILLYTIAQSPTRQGLHDRLARTAVLKVGRRPG